MSTTATATRKINLSLAQPGQTVAYSGRHLTITRVTPASTGRVWVSATRMVEGTEVPETFGADVRALCYLLPEPEATHTCTEPRGLTPAQLTDACPRCQQLLHR